MTDEPAYAGRKQGCSRRQYEANIKTAWSDT
jgi:hypothetical protein